MGTLLDCRNRYYATVSRHLLIGTGVMIFCCLSVGCLPAVYPTCTFTKHLAPLPYLTLYFYFCKWGREELNLQCLPLGNWFTVSRNTANRCRFPRTAIRRLAIIIFVPCMALSCFVLTMIQQEYPSFLLLNEVLMLPFRGLDASAPQYNCPWYHTAKT